MYRLFYKIVLFAYLAENYFPSICIILHFILRTKHVLSFPPDIRLTRNTSSSASSGTSELTLVGERTQKSSRRVTMRRKNRTSSPGYLTARARERERGNRRARPAPTSQHAHPFYFHVVDASHSTIYVCPQPARVDHFRPLLRKADRESDKGR